MNEVDMGSSSDMWKTKPPSIIQYQTITGSSIDGIVMELINDGWDVYGLPQTLVISNNIVVTQTMVMYADE